MIQDLLSQYNEQSTPFLELCNAMYEREIKDVITSNFSNAQQVQNKLKSLPHYIKRTAGSMLNVESPMLLDLQNASWSIKQSKHPPIKEQTRDNIKQWYTSTNLTLGLIVPVLMCSHSKSRVILDCIDKIDLENERFRTNFCGWFYLQKDPMNNDNNLLLLKPNKKVLSAACGGHQWQGNSRTSPFTLSLRELLLSCQINWHNLRTTPPLK